MPTFSKSTIQENRKLFLESNSASLNLSKSHLFYYLEEPIQVLSGHYIFISVLDAFIPVSFYQQSGVILSGSVGGSNFSFTIPNGSYTSLEMVTELNSQFTSAGLSCIVSYNKKDNKMTFTVGNGVSITLNASSHLHHFGFTNATHNGTTTLTSNQCVDLMPIKNVYIKINNLSIANSFNGKGSRIVAKVPVDVERYGVINYLAHSNISSEIYDKKLDLIEVILCDDNGNEIDFNGVAFSLSLGIVFESKMSYINPMKTNDQEMDYINGQA